MNFRPLAPLLALLLVLTACGGDDDSDASVGNGPSTSVTPPSATTPGTGTVPGPTEGDVACGDLAERYVRRARTLFETEGTPSDAFVDRVRERLTDFDTIAASAGCDETYLTGVCEGLDALTQEGILVIIPLTTAQCL